MKFRLGLKVKLFAVTISLFCPLFLLAAVNEKIENRIVIQVPGGEEIEAKPRQTVTLAWLVSNLSAQVHEVIPSITLPEGWQKIASEDPFSLNPGETTLRLVSVSVPLRAMTGDYKVHYSVQTKEDPSVSDVVSVTVRVLLVPKIEVQVIDAPQVVFAGDTYQPKFLVRNLSNAPFTISLSIKSSEGYPFDCDESELELRAGEAQSVKITVRTDRKIVYKHSHHLELLATVKEITPEKIMASGFTSVDVIPRESGQGDLFQRLPTSLSFIGFAGQGTGQVAQVAFSGLGAVKGKPIKNIEFLFRGPGRTELMTFGFFREEYRMLIDTDQGYLFLGDRVFSLSKLTEYGHYGRGAEGHGRWEPFSLKAYYQESLFEIPHRKQIAWQVGYGTGRDRNFSLNFNYLSNEKTDSPKARVYSIETKFSSRPLNLRFEYGFSEKGEADTKDNRALWVEAFGELKNKLHYRVNRIDAGSNYPGCYSDLVFNSAEFHLSPFMNLGVRAAYSDMQNNRQNNPAFSTNFEKFLILGLKYQFSSSLDSSLDYRVQDRRALFPSPLFDYQDRTVRFGLNRRFDSVNLGGLVDIGKTTNRLSGEVRDLAEFNISAHISCSKKLTLGGFFYYRHQDSNFTGDKERSMNVMVNLGLKLERTEIQAFYRTSLYYDFIERILSDQSLVEEMLFNQMNLFEAGIKQKLYRGHSIALRFRIASLSPRDIRGKTQMMGLLEYTIPLGIPVSRNTEEGMLTGRVLDGEASGKGLAGVIVKVNGRTTGTNEEGRFFFYGLKPGTYSLDIERRTIGPNLVTSVRTPVEVEVEGGRKKEFNLVIIKGSSISGRVMLFRFEGEDPVRSAPSPDIIEQRKLVESHGLANTLVELRGESDIFYQFTDDKGSFRFDGLRPGKWALKIVADQLPDFHYLEKESYYFELGQNKGEELLIQVLPRVRPVRIIQKGEASVVQSVTEKESKRESNRDPEGPEG